jgi:3-oxoadipate enol-lactonase
MSTVELNYERAGTAGTPVLLLGGSLGATAQMWAPQIRGLQNRLDLVAFEHRGHGQSPAPAGPYSVADLGRDVLALMDRLGLERASYCGLSIGGMVGLWLAANAPERIERLIAMCTSAYAPPASAWQERAAQVRAAGTPAVVAATVVQRWFTPAWAQQHPDVVAACQEMIAGTDVGAYAACAEAIGAFDLRDELPAITAPTLVISAAEDHTLPPAHQQQIAALIPGARLESIADAAHLANIQHPDVVNRLLAAHLGVSAGAAGATS